MEHFGAAHASVKESAIAEISDSRDRTSDPVAGPVAGAATVQGPIRAITSAAFAARRAARDAANLPTDASRADLLAAQLQWPADMRDMVDMPLWLFLFARCTGL